MHRRNSPIKTNTYNIRYSVFNPAQFVYALCHGVSLSVLRNEKLLLNFVLFRNTCDRQNSDCSINSRYIARRTGNLHVVTGFISAARSAFFGLTRSTVFWCRQRCTNSDSCLWIRASQSSFTERLWRSTDTLLDRGRQSTSDAISVDDFGRYWNDKVDAARQSTEGSSDEVFFCHATWL